MKAEENSDKTKTVPINLTSKMLFQEDGSDFWSRPNDKRQKPNESFDQGTIEMGMAEFRKEQSPDHDPIAELESTVEGSETQRNRVSTTIEIAERQHSSTSDIGDETIQYAESRHSKQNTEPTLEIDFSKIDGWMQSEKKKTGDSSDQFKSLLVVEEKEHFLAQVVSRAMDELPVNNVRIKVEYSSLNYKDALAIAGQPGVAKSYPHVPGIDAAGVVEDDPNGNFQKGDRVIVTGFDLGVGISGGLSEYICVPEDWVVPMPEKMTSRDAMMYGTAGLTAGLCVDLIIKHGVSKHHPILVTGASGGVGMLSITILSKLGYKVTAASRKENEFDYLIEMGASETVHSDRILLDSQYALMQQQWGAVIDTLGGVFLEAAIKGTNYGGLVCSCGLAYDSGLNINVFPFILRAVLLQGIDTVRTDMKLRKRIWKKLANKWKPDNLEEMVREIELSDVPHAAFDMLEGKHKGRTIVAL